ncbi:MAG TPA: hypothetical protein VMT19_10575 [Thermoanaerobaculaceae bacterium]|nr:hypothetical protein [Thermoanaerobaculaceae bacterium]
MHGARRAAILTACAAALSCLVALVVYRGAYSGWLGVLWAAAVALLVAAAVPAGAVRDSKRWLAGHRREAIACAAVVLLPLVPRVANLSLLLTQPDEFALAWFSHEVGFSHTNVFGPIPAQPIWDHQMPSLFFVLQKAFFLVAGETPFDVKLSTMPYVIVTAVALFLLGNALLGRTAAFLSVVAYAFLAPSVYADTFATPITTSMAFSLVFLLVCVLNARRQRPGTALFAGTACAFCYLGLPTSYLALPLLLTFAVVASFGAPRRAVLRGLGAALLAFVIVLLPYAAGAARSADYFAERITVVAPVVGPLFGVKPPPAEVARSRSNLVAKWKAHLEYLWKDDVGGCAGFNFGQAALFDPLTLAAIGIGAALALAVRGKRIEFLMVLGVIAGSFLGLGFANPPPMITRYAALFPLFALLLTVPLAKVLSWSGRPAAVRIGVAAVVIVVLAGFNVHHFRSALARDLKGGREDTEDVKVALYLKDHFPGRGIRVAAFPGFQLEYALRFFLPGTPVSTDYHDNYLKSFDPTKSYLYVVLFPEEFDPKFKKADPNGEVIRGVSRKYSLFVSRGSR